MKFILPSLNLRIERWKWNKEYRIYVSTMGNFKDEHKRNIPIKINQGGYVLINTPYGRQFAHRLVMFTWKPIPNAESLTVDHLNHNKRDNSIYNLEWVTKEENLKRAMEDIDKNQGYYIIGETQKFLSYRDAADWIIKTKNLKNTKCNKNTVANKIRKAVKENKLYNDIEWRMIKNDN